MHLLADLHLYILTIVLLFKIEEHLFELFGKHGEINSVKVRTYVHTHIPTHVHTYIHHYSLPHSLSPVSYLCPVEIKIKIKINQEYHIFVLWKFFVSGKFICNYEYSSYILPLNPKSAVLFWPWQYRVSGDVASHRRGESEEEELWILFF